MEGELLDLISEEYASLGPVEKSEKAEGYSINSQNYIIHFPKGKALCKYLPNGDERKLLKLVSIMKFCEENGAKVPMVIETDSGKLANKHHSGVVYLLKYLEGEYFRGTSAEIGDFAEQAAVLHRCLGRCNIEYDSGIDFSKYCHLSPEDMDSIVSEIRERSGKNEFDEYVLGCADFLKGQYEKNKAEEKKINKNEIVIQYIHRDLHPGNVLFCDGKAEIILDFNSLVRGELVRDVAFACYRFALYNARDKGEIGKRRDAFIKSYLQANRLSEEERGHLKHYFVNECLNRVSYILRSHYFENSTEWSFDLKKHINNINIIKEI